MVFVLFCSAHKHWFALWQMHFCLACSLWSIVRWSSKIVCIMKFALHVSVWMQHDFLSSFSHFYLLNLKTFFGVFSSLLFSWFSVVCSSVVPHLLTSSVLGIFTSFSFAAYHFTIYQSVSRRRHQMHNVMVCVCLRFAFQIWHAITWNICSTNVQNLCTRFSGIELACTVWLCVVFFVLFAHKPFG